MGNEREKMITVKILFFSTIRARIGIKELEFEIPIGSTILDLKRSLADRFPQAAPAILNMHSAVNQVFSRDETVIPEGAVVAFFPHVTGG
jgi:molybdopterin converting factor small subunit